MQLFPLRSCHCSCSFTCRNNICCTSEFGKSHWVIANAVESWSLIYVIYIYCIIQYRLHIEIVLFLLVLNRRPHASLTVRVAVVQLLDLKQPQDLGVWQPAWQVAGGIWRCWYHSLSSQGSRWQFSSYILWLTETIARTSKTDRYILRNSRGSSLAIKRTLLVLKVVLAHWRMQKGDYRPHLFITIAQTLVLADTAPLPARSTLCFCLVLNVSAHRLWPVCWKPLHFT